jgi:hypothetical protein
VLAVVDSGLARLIPLEAHRSSVRTSCAYVNLEQLRAYVTDADSIVRASAHGATRLNTPEIVKAPGLGSRGLHSEGGEGRGFLAWDAVCFI